jgi:hypothetical protein
METPQLYEEFRRMVPAHCVLVARDILMQVLTDLLDQEGYDNMEKLQQVIGATRDALAAFAATGDEKGVKCFEERLAHYQKIRRLAELIEFIEPPSPCSSKVKGTLSVATTTTATFLENNFNFI